MIKIYLPKHYQSMPWKNGKGTTRQLLIEPASAKFPIDPFAWRVSSAPISEAGEFSKFPGYHRALMLIRGNGLRLNGEPLNLFETFTFTGETQVLAELTNTTVVDFGIIYNPNLVKVEMKYLRVVTGESNFLELAPNETLLIYWLNGSGKIENETILSDEIATIEHASEVKLTATEPSQLVYIRIA